MRYLPVNLFTAAAPKDLKTLLPSPPFPFPSPFSWRMTHLLFSSGSRSGFPFSYPSLANLIFLTALFFFVVSLEGHFFFVIIPAPLNVHRAQSRWIFPPSQVSSLLFSPLFRWCASVTSWKFYPALGFFSWEITKVYWSLLRSPPFCCFSAMSVWHPLLEKRVFSLFYTFLGNY